MKTKTFLALFVCALVASAIAQAPATCTAAEAAKHVGEIVTVADRVDGVHQSGRGNIFLNMGGKYPNQAFTAWIPSASAGMFSNPQQYEGKLCPNMARTKIEGVWYEISRNNVSEKLEGGCEL